MIGVIIFFVFLASIIHYSGGWYSVYLPMSDSNIYDNTGKLYNVSRILSADYTLDVEAYSNYSSLFLRYVCYSRIASSLILLISKTAPPLPCHTACPLLLSPH